MNFTEDRTGIRYREEKSPAVAVLCAAFSLIFLVLGGGLATELVTWPLTAGSAAGVLTVVVFVSFSLLVAFLAAASMQPQHLHFDAAKRRLRGRARGRFWLTRTVDAGFDALGVPAILTQTRESDPDLFEIHIPQSDAPPIRLGAYDDRAQAELWRERIARLVEVGSEAPIL